ncbi:MAG TPA: AAA family ATPase [Candidatus Limnocylindrales bacterium]|nr:AAA family ATPase [Candidatus Limnocylindrales bacterium]
MAGRLVEERRLVTALAADLAGSTALAEQLDPEEARLVVAEALRRIVAVVEQLGGTVKDLAGDGVLALFGAPLAHEDDAARAVRAGLAVTAEMNAYGDEVAAGWRISGFGARVGIETGELALGPIGGGARVEYGATGDAVNVAARLQAEAPLGGVLVGRATYRAVGQLFEWDAPRTLQLRGHAAPVEARLALSARSSAGRPRGLEGVEAPLVGRDLELAQADRSVEAVLGGSGGLLLVTGEPGIGKSRLLAELRVRFSAAESSGLHRAWLEGACVSYGEALPYWPFQDLLRHWLGVGADEPRLRVQVALRRRLEALFGDDSGEIEPALALLLGIADEPHLASVAADTPASLRQRTAVAIRRLLARLAADGPVVVAVDDAHWADASSVELMQRLLPIVDEEAVLLVVTARGERDTALSALREAALADTPHRTHEVRLEELRSGADRALLEALVGPDTLPEATSLRILEAAEGNPFYLEELVRSLIDAGALVAEGERWRFERHVPIEVPETVEKVILTRVDRLRPAAREVLAVASVLGRRFGLPLLQAVLGETGGAGAPSPALRDLLRLDLVREERRWPEPEYRFKHLLIQETVYRTLLRSQRRDLHRTAARAIERLFAGRLDEHYGVLARHYRRADDVSEALRYAGMAAEAASRVYARSEAMEHYATALELAGRPDSPAPPPQVAALRLGRGWLAYRTGDHAAAREDMEIALHLARAAGERALESQALEAMGELLASGGSSRIGDSVPYLEASLALAEELGDVVRRVSILNRLSIVHAHELDLAAGLDSAQRAMALAEASGDERVVARALDGLKANLLHLGDVQGLEQATERLIGILQREGGLWYLQFALFESAFVSVARADWEGAIARMREGMAVNERIADRGNEPMFLGGLALVEATRGEYAAALAYGSHAVEAAGSLGHGWWLAWCEAVQARTLLELGDAAAALEHLQRGFAAAKGAGGRAHLVRCASQLAWALRLTGETKRAEQLGARIEAELARVRTPPARAFVGGSVAYLALARLHLAGGRARQALALVEPLLAAAEADGWQDVRAAAGLIAALALEQAGRGDEAQVRATEALGVAEAAGIAAVAWEAAAVLARLAAATGDEASAEAHRGTARRWAARIERTLPPERRMASFAARVEGTLSGTAHEVGARPR